MSKSKVLIVEDEAVSRRILLAMLGRDYSVIPAASGAEAIVLAGKHHPDLVLLDIEMPGMDGFETMERLRDGVISEAVPVIFVTGREDTESRDKGLEAGAVDYLVKPYDRRELSIKTKNHLALYQARKEIEQRNLIMAREMEMASQLQNSLMPKAFPDKANLSFSVLYKPLSRAGGDFYDICEFPDEQIAVTLVDVSGHGVAAAMIGAMFKMAFQSFAGPTISPAPALAVINDQMTRVLPDSDFLTVFYLVIDPKTLKFSYCNAGHPRPFLFRYAGGETHELRTGGPLLGAFPNMRYEEEEGILFPGDRILLYTDGITETSNTAGEFYGEDALRSLALLNMRRPGKEILDLIMLDLDRFRGSAPLNDDISVIMISAE